MSLIAEGEAATGTERASMPKHLKLGLALVLGVIIAAAVFIFVNRGAALLLDLSALSGVFCS